MLTGQATLGNGLESKLSLDIKLLKYKESFAYKLRKLRDLLFQENVNGSMSSEQFVYRKIWKNCAKVRHEIQELKKALKCKVDYQVGQLEKKMLQTKEVLHSHVNEN